MKGKAWRFILIVSLLLNFSVAAGAGYFYCRDSLRRWHSGREARHALMAKKLDLTPAQQKTIKERDAEFGASVAKMREDIAKKRKALLEIIKQENPDRDSIDALLTEISAMQKDMESQVVDHLLAEKSVLSKKQRSKYIEMFEDRMEKRKLRRDKR